MTDREKLIELIISSGQVYGFVGALADHLIINGVTVCEREMLRQTYEQGKYEGALEVQKWIPVTERLPEDDEGIVKNMVDEDFGFLTVLVYNGVVKQTNRYFSKENIYGLPKTNGWEWASFNVTHWMPLPEPPKEDEA